jgi:hypothetical protein
MPKMRCPKCLKLQPVRWDNKNRVWRFWVHGPEEKRCAGGGVVVGTRPSDLR